MTIGIKKKVKAMRKELIILAALMCAVAAFFSCQKVKDVTPNTYSLIVEAAKGASSEAAKALALSGSTLNATWSTTENVYVKKGNTWATGSLQPQAAAATATLKGDLSGVTFAADDNITLQFPKSGDITYAGQVGTLADIAANFDWSTASATVASVEDGKITVADDVAFQNQQAIVKFTLKNKADGGALSVAKLVVKVGSTEYEVNPAAAVSEIFVALPGFSDQTVILTVTTNGNKTYSYFKPGVTFENGKYYTRSVKLEENKLLSQISMSDIGRVIGVDGKIYSRKETAEAAGTTASGIIAFVLSAGAVRPVESYTTYRGGLAIALSDANDGAKCSSGLPSLSACVTREGSLSTALTYWNGLNNTNILAGGCGASHSHPAAQAAWSYSTARPVGVSGWFLPSIGQWNIMVKALTGVSSDLATAYNNSLNYTAVNTKITAAGGIGIQPWNYWTSTECSSVDDWTYAANVGNAEVVVRSANQCYVRAAFAF